ncbi:GtrA family protein [Streptococcus himalayensis]|uniref:Sugar translocase n=1 Tax=Streptococcus himalayensis TaxID=1888195 RepID=A0A917AC92_9STRE|nr:GtrA family protein [Streptococcus himalayensis]GGE37956.1 sugar translocase [Streptococcus himalayensis]
MKKLIKAFFDNEILSYLFFGVVTTVVYLVTRLTLFSISKESLLATAVANIIAVLFAFLTNDVFVFKQARAGWFSRLVKFGAARLLTFCFDIGMTFLFIKQFPHIIGQFVDNDAAAIDFIESLIAQVSIIVLNYILSKLFVFKNHPQKTK